MKPVKCECGFIIDIEDYTVSDVFICTKCQKDTPLDKLIPVESTPQNLEEARKNR